MKFMKFMAFQILASLNPKRTVNNLYHYSESTVVSAELKWWDLCDCIWMTVYSESGVNTCICFLQNRKIRFLNKILKKNSNDISYELLSCYLIIRNENFNYMFSKLNVPPSREEYLLDISHSTMRQSISNQMFLKDQRSESWMKRWQLKMTR
jgi:hypothetical protein